MKTRLLALPLLFALVGTLAACGGGSPSVPANAVALVNGQPILRSDYNGFFDQAVAVAVHHGQPKPQPGTQAYTTTVNQVIAYLVQAAEVEQQAPKVGVSESQQGVTDYLTNLANSSYGGSMEKLTAALKKQGLSMKTARAEVFVNLLAQKIKTKVISTAKVTPDQEQKYYHDNIAQYQVPAETTRDVQYILVKKKSLAEQLNQKLQNGASFTALAKKYSEDSTTAPTGGKFTVTKGRVVPAFDKEAFALNTGETSGVVDATSAANQNYGYFLIKALGPVKNTKAHTTSFNDAEATIKATLLQQAQDTLWQKWLTDLTNEYKGKVFYQSGYAPPTTTALPTTSGYPTTTSG